MSIVNRAKNILLSPKTEWEVIAKEQNTVGGLFTGYAMILAAIPVVMAILFTGLLGIGAAGLGSAMPGMSIGVGLVAGMAAIGYALGLLVIWLVSMIVNAIAPSFNGEKDMTQATKLMVYAATPTWVAGLAAWIPVLGMLISFAAIAYAVYLIYLGVKPVLGVPDDKVAGMTVVTVLVYIVLYFLITVVITGIIVATLFASLMGAGLT